MREGLILAATGATVVACGLYIYFVAHEVFPDTESSRLRDFNWLLEHLGRLPLSVLVCLIGAVMIRAGKKRASGR